MDIGGVREAMTRQPFLPFQLRLADGRSLPISHPDFITVSPNNRRVVVFTPPDDAMSVVEPLLIVSIEYPGVPAPGSNGAGANGSPGA
jgi:hypothetical protein